MNLPEKRKSYSIPVTAQQVGKKEYFYEITYDLTPRLPSMKGFFLSTVRTFKGINRIL